MQEIERARVSPKRALPRRRAPRPLRLPGPGPRPRRVALSTVLAVAHIALIYSCVVTGLVLLAFGAVKARITGAGQGVGGYVWGAFSTLLVGGAAAAAAYGIVAALEG